jgi:catechol 2,3-dioxygenase-like lactoylglutathione lyase family enzyme
MTAVAPSSTVLGHRLRVSHVALSVDDLERSVDWYRTVFDAEIVRAYAHPEHRARVAWVAFGGFAVELIELAGSDPHPTPGATPEVCRTQGFVHICFEVDDCQAVATQLKARGATVVWDVQVWDEQQIRTANFADVDGNIIEILEDLTHTGGSHADL